MIITTDKQMRPRDPHDFYPTPEKLVIKALEDFRVFAAIRTGYVKQPGVIIDPGAGTGVWGSIARRMWPQARIEGFEIRDDAEHHPDYDLWHTRDYLNSVLVRPYADLIIGNPPYKLAEEFIRRSWDALAPDGWMVMLLRLAFLEGQARGEGLWSEMPPRAVWVCSARPSFITEGEKAGKTDATAYAVFVWKRNAPPLQPTELGWLDWKI